MRSTPTLFTGTRLGEIHLRNRVVMAPMTRNRARADGVPTRMMSEYYAQRAAAGLIVAEMTQVSPDGQAYVDTPGIHSDAQVEGWRAVTDAVHRAGGRIVLQLGHGGRISHSTLQPGGALPVAPSALAPSGSTYTRDGLRPFETPRALATEEVEGVVRTFAAAASRAREAGFDGVELHAANGYLLDQFLRDGTNHRTDRFGGSVENRVRLLVEVAGAALEAWGAGRVGVRVSPLNPFNDMSDSDPVVTFSHAARALGALPLAYLHVVEPVVPSPATRRITPVLRRLFGGPVIVNGSYDRASAEAALDAGEADAVSFGSAFLANPDLPHRLAVGAPLNEPDPATFYQGGSRGYTDYPSLDRGRGAAPDRWERRTRPSAGGQEVAALGSWSPGDETGTQEVAGAPAIQSPGPRTGRAGGAVLGSA